MLTDVFFETVYMVDGLFCFINFLKKPFNIDIKQKDFSISSIYFKSIENNLYLLVARFNKPNKLEKKPVKH